MDQSQKQLMLQTCGRLSPESLQRVVPCSTVLPCPTMRSMQNGWGVMVSHRSGETEAPSAPLAACLFRVLVHAGMPHVPGLLHCRFGCGAPHRRGSQPSEHQRVELKTALVLEVKLRLVRLAEVSVWPSTISRSPRKSAVSF